MTKLFTKDTVIDEVLSEDPRYDILEDDGTPYKSGMQINLASPVSVAGTSINADLLNNLEDGLDAVDSLLSSIRNDATELTISSDAITITQSNHKLQPQTGTSDNLSTINGTVAGQSGVLYPSDFGTDTITIKHAVGNIRCMGGNDITLQTGCVFWYSNGTIVFISGGGGIAWGGITGTLSNQSDLQTALNAKINTDGWVSGTGTWSYSSADSPTFVISINADVTAIITVGMKIKLTQTTTKYFIVTAVGSYSGSATLVTVYGGTDYTLANAAISNPYYSSDRAPLSFPLDPSKWTVSVSDSNNCAKSTPTASTWYGNTDLSPTAPSISIPIGIWHVEYGLTLDMTATLAAVGTVGGRVTLSTASNSESDSSMSKSFATVFPIVTGGVLRVPFNLAPMKILTLASKTTYYLDVYANVAAITAFNIRGDLFVTVIRARCAYL